MFKHLDEQVVGGRLIESEDGPRQFDQAKLDRLRARQIEAVRNLDGVFEKLFERFPNLRVASVENGSEFLPDLFRKLKQTTDKMPGWFKDDPAETFKRHVWINPFWEDDVNEVVEMMGPERVIFGSDWPHIEGLPQPLDYLQEVASFDATSQRKIL